MKLELMDVDHFVRVNSLQRVTDVVFLEGDGAATRGGLFSAEIFGRPGSEERRMRWAYIDLGGRFIHPLIYKACCQLDRNFPDLVAGDRRFRVAPGGGPIVWVDDEDPGPALRGTGDLYDAWSRIDWGATSGGGARAQRAGLLKAAPPDRAFCTKWPVIPAAYRDVDTGRGRGGRIREVAPINYLYTRIITSAPSVSSGFQFADGARKLRAQEALLEAHQAMLALVSKKHGLIQDRILGKYADYAVQGVISGPSLAKCEGPADQEVPFGYVGIPLYLVINLFQPFIIKSLEERLRAFSGAQERFLSSTGDYIELPAEARAQLNPDTYRRWIGRYMRSQGDRNAPLSVVTGRGDTVEIPLYDAQLGRKTTLTDLFYVTAYVVVSDKHVMFTRYPIEDFRNCQFAKVSILTTEETEVRTLGQAVYRSYPKLGPGERWVDSIRINNSYTSALGADYDGDRIRIFGLFTQEANAEAARLIASPPNFVDGQGRPSRDLKNEGVLTLYSLTA